MTRFDVKSVAAAYRTRAIYVAVLLSLVAVLSGCGHEPRLNVVVITIDTLRADHLACYGYPKPTSPRMDEFAGDNVLFETVACQSSQTLPSHTSIFTGLNVRTHKVISHESPLADELTPLAEILKDRGYTTGAFISSHALDSKYNLTQGFDTYWQIHKKIPLPERVANQDRMIDPTTDAALEWLDEHGKSSFFLWIHWFHPHRPYNPPQRYRQEFAGGYDGPASSEPDFIMKVWRERIRLADADVNHLIGRYDGEIAFSDVQVGRILDRLAAMDLMATTIVIVTSDHGEILYEHEYYFGHDIALYDECIMIPLIIHAPELEIGRARIDEFVQSIDILPTLLDLLRVDHPTGLEGKSLLPLIAGAVASTVDFCFLETFPFPEKCPPRHAVRTADDKIIWKETVPDSLIKEYYDLLTDPAEQENLYPDPRAARLDSILTEWIKPEGLHPAPIPTAKEAGRWRILKSLGYVD
jgi:arylsulfatase A-like enzyme